MKQILIITLFLAIGYIQAAINPGVQSPIGSPTAVPSAGQRSLIPSQAINPGMSGDLVMSGNVGGGKEFRGVLPYSSRIYSKSFSSSVDNFIRRTSGDPLATDRNPGVYTPYYDPRRTTTSMYRGGQTGLVAPQLNSQASPATFIPSGLAQLRNTQFNLDRRPLSTSPDDVSQIIDRQMLKNQWDNPLKMDKEILTKNKKVEQDKEPVLFKPENLPPHEFFKDRESEKEEKTVPEKEEINRYQKIREEMEKDLQQQQEEAAEKKTEQGQEASLESQPEESELKGYHTYAELADAKALEYMNQAQEFLGEGKFYKAADSFALAAVWKPDDAQTWIGQVGSLFAAGEYMSSAYYLEKVLTLKPEFAVKKVPQAILIQKRDTFENSLLETQTWQERSQSGELAFLMAYMLWQDGKTERAVDVINRAQTLIPDSEAIKNLAAVIRSSGSLPVSPEKPAGQGGSSSESGFKFSEIPGKDPNRP